MRILPLQSKVFHFDPEHDPNAPPPAPATLVDCADSTVAVLEEADLARWMTRFAEVAQAEDAADYCDFHTCTLVFEIDGRRLVVVSDSGGELATGEFQAFCAENGIPCQFIIDGLDCTSVAPADIYTGTGGGDNLDLLTLVHRIYN